MILTEKSTLKHINYLVLGVIIVSVNSILVHVLRKLRKLSSVSHRFIFILSLSDISIGVVFLCTSSLIYIENEDHYRSVHTYSIRVLYFQFQFSFLMVITIATDRYIHMRFPTKYATIMTNSRGVKIIIGVLLATVLMNVVIICGDLFGFSVLAYILFYSVDTVLLTALFIQYTRAYRALRRRVNELFLDGNRASYTPQITPSKEFAKAVFLILSSAFICYTPIIVSSMIIYLDNHELGATVKLASRGLLSLNSAFNAVIFMAFNRDIKRFVKQRIKTLCGIDPPPQSQ